MVPSRHRVLDTPIGVVPVIPYSLVHLRSQSYRLAWSMAISIPVYNCTSDHCHCHHRHRHLRLHSTHPPLHHPHPYPSEAKPFYSFAWKGAWILSRDSMNRRGFLVLRMTPQTPRHRRRPHLFCSFPFLSGETMTSHSAVSQSLVTPGVPSEHPSTLTRTLQPPTYHAERPHGPSLPYR